MANWAYTSYAIEGNKETVEKIFNAIQNPILDEGASEGWEGGVLKALNIEWENKKPDGTGYYMRGFIEPDSVYLDDGVLSFEAQEAWGATDFADVLNLNLKDTKAFYSVEEEGGDVYATNDKEGKYFPDRYWVDTCIDGNYQSEYFTTEEAMYEWLKKITNGRVFDLTSAEDFNDDYEDNENADENFINIHEFAIVE